MSPDNSTQAMAGLRNLREVLRERITPLSLLTDLFLLITAIAIMLPLHPHMPGVTLDQSWALGIDQAVAQHLHFGRDIMFTYGPYAAVCHQYYHPATYLRMIGGSALIGFSYVAALLFLADGRRIVLVLTALVFVTCIYPDFGVVLCSYPFLIGLCACKLIAREAKLDLRAKGLKQIIVLISMLAALGLLPLIKDSFLVPVVALLLLMSALFWRFASSRYELLWLLCPFSCSVAFWKLAGQDLSDIPHFVSGALLLTSGYSEAMASSTGPLTPLLFLATVLIVLLLSISIARYTSLQLFAKSVFGCHCAISLFIAFKLGFVRGDHLVLTFTTAAMIGLLCNFFYTDRYLTAATGIAIAAILIISVGEDLQQQRPGDIARSSVKALYRTTLLRASGAYKESWDGVRRIAGYAQPLQAQFKDALYEIHSQYAVPELPGTSDSYNFTQCFLLASSNRWNPRLVPQSYSVYTPLLPKLNEDHLRHAQAPDWVLFRPETIDDRLPSLDDGLSWPALLDNYNLKSVDEQYALLHKNAVVKAASSFTQMPARDVAMEEAVPAPRTNAPVFARIEATPGLVGKLVGVAFRAPHLEIELTLDNGKVISHRVNANMMSTGFVVSPLVTNATDFAALVQDHSSRASGRVTSFRLHPSHGGPLFWNPTYRLNLAIYNSGASAQ